MRGPTTSKRKTARGAVSLLCAALLLAACGGQYEFESLYTDLPFEMPRVQRPDIPATKVSVADFGGKGDGVSLNTEAFAAAIEALTGKGGGHLIVPKGIWLTGPIALKDNIDLHITEEAVLLFSTDRDLYPIIETVFEGLDTKRCMAPLFAEGARNISITGKGTIDGQGDSWRQVKREKLAPSAWKTLLAGGGFTDPAGKTWYPDSSSYRGSLVSDAFNVPQGMESDEDWEAVKTYLRPELLCFKECENLLLEGPLFQNSPCWNIHPLLCKNVIIKDIRVRNPWYSQNGDGLDIDSCENVIVTGSSFDVGDDAICIKSGKDEDGRRRARPCRNLIVDNCTVFHGHGGFVVGSEMSGGVSNISVRNCRFLGTDVGLRFKSCRGRGGVVENIFIDGILMMDIPTEPLLFDLHYGGKSALEARAVENAALQTTAAEKDGSRDIAVQKEETNQAIAASGKPVASAANAVGSPERGNFTRFDIEPAPVDETTPEFRAIRISNILCKGAARAMYFNGIPEKRISGISVSETEIICTKGADLRYSDGIELRNVRILQSQGDGYSFANCDGIELRGCSDASPAGLTVFQHNTTNFKTSEQ